MKIVSMLSTVTMKEPFDLDEVLTKLPEAEPLLKWVKLKYSPNKNHFSIYENGKILIYGTKSEDELINLANDFILYLNKHGIYNEIKEIKVNNYVIITQLDFDINLESLFVNLLDYDVIYEPEQFPALKFKDKYGITYLLFGTGKITIVGVKSLDNLEEHFAEFKDLIREKSNI